LFKLIKIQVLETKNLAIARNCDAPIDKVKGAEAKGSIL
jgi:hypothetical protein